MTTMMTRRALFAFAGGTALSLPLMATTCTTQQVNAAIQNLGNTIASFINADAAFAKIANVPADTLAKINSYVVAAAGFVQAQTAIIEDTSATTLQKALLTVQNILISVSPFASDLPAPLNEIVPAAFTMTPIIASVLGIVIPPLPTLAKTGAVAPMSPTKAELALAYYAQKQ